jgi:hypothetical protein
VTGSIRFHEMLRHPGHTLLLWAAWESAWREALDVAEQLTGRLAGHLRAVAGTPLGNDTSDRRQMLTRVKPR